MAPEEASFPLLGRELAHLVGARAQVPDGGVFADWLRELWQELDLWTQRRGRQMRDQLVRFRHLRPCVLPGVVFRGRGILRAQRCACRRWEPLCRGTRGIPTLWFGHAGICIGPRPECVPGRLRLCFVCTRHMWDW